MTTDNECEMLIIHGLGEFQKDNLQQAWECFQAANDAECATVGVHGGFGAVYERIDKSENAFAAYDYAIENCLVIPKPMAAMYNNRGRIYARIGLRVEALADFRQAAALDPENARAHFNIGGILDRHNQFSDALESYGRSAELGYEPAIQAVAETKAELTSNTAGEPSAVSNLNDNAEDVTLSHIMIRLAKFAYATMGTDHRQEMVTKKTMLGFKSKTELNAVYKWSTLIEELHIANTDGYKDSPIGVTLEVHSQPPFMIRVKILDAETYNVAISKEIEIKAAGQVQKGYKNKQEHSYTVNAPEFDNFLKQLLSDGTLSLQDKMLTFDSE